MNNIEKTTNVIIEGKELSSSISFLFNISTRKHIYTWGTSY